MILNNQSTSENNTGFTSSRYQIKASVQAFKILSSSLYSNKPRAVLRELSANALDAHIAAGKKDVPIQITLPTSLNPVLEVTDFGIGLTKQQLESIYTTYFDSTKTSSNNEVGGFGLGSKSPFAIAESFTVTSVKDGELTTVINYTDKGEPKFIITEHQLNVTRPNGTTVIVPVESESYINDLIKEARDLFAFWETKPTLYNTSSVLNSTFSKTAAPNVWMTKAENYYSLDSFTLSDIFKNVAVGPFLYEIPKQLIQQIHTQLFTLTTEFSTKFKDYVKAVSLSDRINLVIQTNIGDIELAPSRERIEVTEENQTYLKQAIINAIGYLYHKFEQDKGIMITELEVCLDKFGFDPFLGFTIPQRKKVQDYLVTRFGDYNTVYALTRTIKQEDTAARDLLDRLKGLLGHNREHSIIRFLPSIFFNDEYNHYGYIHQIKMTGPYYDNAVRLSVSNNTGNVLRKKDSINERTINRPALYVIDSTNLKLKDKKFINLLFRYKDQVQDLDSNLPDYIENYREVELTTDLLKKFKLINTFAGEPIINIITIEDLIKKYSIEDIEIEDKPKSSNKVTRGPSSEVPVGLAKDYLQGTPSPNRTITVYDLYEKTSENNPSTLVILVKDAKGMDHSYLDHIAKVISKFEDRPVSLFYLQPKEFKTKRFENFIKSKVNFSVIINDPDEPECFHKELHKHSSTIKELTKLGILQETLSLPTPWLTRALKAGVFTSELLPNNTKELLDYVNSTAVWLPYKIFINIGYSLPTVEDTFTKTLLTDSFTNIVKNPESVLKEHFRQFFNSVVSLIYTKEKN